MPHDRGYICKLSQEVVSEKQLNKTGKLRTWLYIFGVKVSATERHGAIPRDIVETVGVEIWVRTCHPCVWDIKEDRIMYPVAAVSDTQTKSKIKQKGTSGNLHLVDKPHLQNVCTFLSWKTVDGSSQDQRAIETSRARAQNNQLGGNKHRWFHDYIVHEYNHDKSLL